MISYTVFISSLSAFLFYQGLHFSENKYLQSIIDYHYSMLKPSDNIPMKGINIDLNTSIYPFNSEHLPNYIIEESLGSYEVEMEEIHYRIALHPNGEKIVIIHEDVAKLLDAQEENLEIIISVLVLIAALIGSLIVTSLVHLMTKRITLLSKSVDIAKLNSTAIPNNVKNGSSDEIDNLAYALSDYSKDLIEFIDRERYFTRHASHELRTPLSIIKNCYHILLKSNLDDRQIKVVKRIGKSAEKATNLTTSFLILARHHSQINENVNFQEILENLLNEYTPQLEAMGINLYRSTKPCYLVSHPALVEILISNLLNNIVNHAKSSAEVILTEDSISFINDYFNTEPSRGFGIDICQRICQHLEWEFQISRTEANYITTISFHTSPLNF